jgi:hypothetical protein
MGRATMPAMEQTLALIALAAFIGPILHVLLSPKAGPFLPPPGSRCPIGPRFGWLVLVLLLGPIGWVLFLTRRWRRKAGSA